MACAHSTSSDVSVDHEAYGIPLLVMLSTGSFFGRGELLPFWFTTVRNDEAGPYCWYRLWPPDLERLSLSNWSTSPARFGSL